MTAKSFHCPLRWLLLGLFVLCMSAAGDPLAPSLLNLKEHSDGTVEVLWRTPRKMPQSNPLPLQPILPKLCDKVRGSLSTPAFTDSKTRSYRWTIHCPRPLTGLRVGVSNLHSAAANTLLRIETADQRLISTLLTSRTAQLTVPPRQSVTAAFSQYLMYGAHHLAIGTDHVLFVIMLVLLLGYNRRLIIAVTLFTLAHSITLSLSALGYIFFPADLAESLIALSIVITTADHLKDSVTTDRLRYMIIVFCFGLLHGLGFASAVKQIGLPQEEIITSLLGFNIGIEIGQLALIGLLYAAHNHLAPPLYWRLSLSTIKNSPRFISCGIGVLAAFWFWQRLDIFLTT